MRRAWAGAASPIGVCNAFAGLARLGCIQQNPKSCMLNRGLLSSTALMGISVSILASCLGVESFKSKRARWHGQDASKVPTLSERMLKPL